jgi:hypothetical protein
MTDFQKQHIFYLDDSSYKLLKEKANEHFQGKGATSKFLRMIANTPIAFLPKGAVLEIKIK